MKIIYYVDNDSLGGNTAADCDKYREWAKTEIERVYPDYDITVTDEQSLQTCYTDDIDNEEEIIDFCSRLWDLCHWDF